MKLGQIAIDEMCDIQEEFLKKLNITQQEPTKNRYTDDMFAEAQAIISQEKLQELKKI